MSVTDAKLIGSSNPGIYAKISSEQTYNCYISDGCLVSYSGYKSVYDFSSGENRGIYYSKIGGFSIIVNGNTVYRIDNMSAISPASIGAIGTTIGSVYIVENGNSQIALSDGSSYYVYDYGVLPVTFGVVDIGISPNAIAECLGYIFVSANNSNTFIYSNVNDAFTFDVTSTGSLGSDRIIGFSVIRDFVFVIGENSMKPWRNLGVLINPFQLDQSSVYEYGCVQKDTIDYNFDIMAFLGTSKKGNISIMISDGGQKPQIISTDGIDAKISGLNNPLASTGFLWRQDNHLFYQLTFYEDNWTIVYDFQSKSFFYATGAQLSLCHIGADIMNYIPTQKYYMTSLFDSKIYQLDSSFTDYDGIVIPRWRVTPPFRTQKQNMVKFKNLEIIAEQGVSPSGYCEVSYSDNGGQFFQNSLKLPFATFSNNNWSWRIPNLGGSRDRVFSYFFYTPARLVIISATIGVEDVDTRAANG